MLLKLFPRNSVHKAVAAVLNTLELIKIKYQLEGELQLVIKGRVFLSVEKYAALSFSKKKNKKLDKIQKEYYNCIKHSGNNVKTLLEKLIELSKQVSVNYAGVCMLYLHSSVYSLLKKKLRDYISCLDFLDETIRDSRYTKSTKLHGNTKYVLVSPHFSDGSIKRTFNGNTFVFKDNALVDIIFVPQIYVNLLKISQHLVKIGVIDIATY